jgi:hypothetical protein
MFMSAVAIPTEPETILPPLDMAYDGKSSMDHDAEFYCEMLNEIMGAAVDFARAIRQNLRDEAKTATPEIAVAIDRVARVVRRCILLVVKLTEARPARTTDARTRSEARTRVREQVKAAQTRAPPADQVQDKAASETTGSNDRVDRLDRLDTLPPGTVPEIIAGLQKDLTRVATQLGQPGEAHPQPTQQAANPEPSQPQNPTPPPTQPTNHSTQPPNPARAKGSG